MASWAIIATSADVSIRHFPSSAAVYMYDSSYAQPVSGYDVIYFRDPFNTGRYNLNRIEKIVTSVVKGNPSAYYVDAARTIDDFLIEDKWRQYQIFKEYMPHTRLLESPDEITEATLAKKRISTRARGIAFRPQDLKDYPISDYILQERLVIQAEYRTYVVLGEAQPLMSRKTPKTDSREVRVKGLERLPDDIKKFSQSIAAAVPQLDFFGLDIARIDEGLKLIELNRSPQFNRYISIGGNKLADKLVKGLERKRI